MPEAKTAFVTGGSGFIGSRLIRRLTSEGWTVRALARSDKSAAAVTGLGAEAVRGDLDDVRAMRDGAQDCAVAFHAAAAVIEWGPREEFVRANVTGTHNALDACVGAAVGRFVHVGTEAALLAGGALVNVDERAPLRPDSKAYYSATKALAEQAVRDANGDRLETVVVRPRLVWGPGDTSILPGVVRAVEQGRFRWVGGGRHLTSTTHVDNVVEGLLLGAQRGRPGGVYFVTDGEPVVFREFITGLLATQDVEAPDKSVPAPVARLGAGICEAIWRTLRLSSTPPITRLAYWLSALETTIDISRAREELGYAPVRTIADGLDELRTLHESGV